MAGPAAAGDQPAHLLRGRRAHTAISAIPGPAAWTSEAALGPGGCALPAAATCPRRLRLRLRPMTASTASTSPMANKTIAEGPAR